MFGLLERPGQNNPLEEQRSRPFVFSYLDHCPSRSLTPGILEWSDGGFLMGGLFACPDQLET
jgi:hypothetical protein